MYKYIFLDLDNTLWDFNKNSHETLEELFSVFDLSSKGVDDCNDFIIKYKIENEKLWSLYRENKITKDRLRYLRFKKTLNLGMVARLEKHKDQATLIKAIPKILKLGLEVNLFIIGDGSKRKNLEELSLKLGIGERVNFMGSRRDIPNILSKLDIFIFSAKEDEGFGIALAEAMVAGLPILASDAGACLEILNNGEYGYLFKKGNSEDLALKVLQISKDFDNVNQIYETYFSKDKLPARTCIGVTGLAVGASIEIDLIAKT